MDIELLKKLELALQKRNPVLAQRLRSGLKETQIRKKLEKGGVAGNVEPIVQLFSWKNGTDIDSSLTLEQASPFPESIYMFMDLSMMIGHFQGFAEYAKYHPRYTEIVGRYFPFFWDGSSDWLAVDLDFSANTRIVWLITESENAIYPVYSTFEDFIKDAIRANERGEELECFSKPLPSDRFEPCCYFCREPKSKVGRLIQSEHSAMICNRCVALCYDTMLNAGVNLRLPEPPSTTVFLSND